MVKCCFLSIGHRDCINTLVGSGADVNSKDKKVLVFYTLFLYCNATFTFHFFFSSLHFLLPLTIFLPTSAILHSTQLQLEVRPMLLNFCWS